MAARDRIYTVHVNADRTEPTERVMLVREGFSVWAFLFTGFWLLLHRLWIPCAIYLALMVYIVKGGAAIGMSELGIGIMQFALNILLGFSAHDIERWGLARRGYRMQGVVVDDSELHATQRAYERLAV